jgi:hypothetical protein
MFLCFLFVLYNSIIYAEYYKQCLEIVEDENEKWTFLKCPISFFSTNSCKIPISKSGSD